MPRSRRTFDLRWISAVLSALVLSLGSSVALHAQFQPGGGAAAQESTQPGTPGPTPTKVEFTSAVDCYPVTRADSKHTVKSVDDLVNEYNDGRLWLQLQADLKAILSTCQFAPRLTPLTPGDFTSRTFLVTLISSDHRPYYVVVPQPQPYSMTLLGVRSVNAIILGDSQARGDKVPSNFLFMSTQVRNPLEARIPAPAKQAGAAFATNTLSLQDSRVEAATGSRDPAATMYAYAAAGIVLPFRRASISEAGTVTVKDPASGTLADVRVATTYANTPRVHFEFAAVVGAVVGPMHGPQRMKVDAGKYASDPLSHALTMVTVAWHPKPFNSSLSEMSRAERWAVLFGGVLTPATGVGLGVSFDIMRNVAINSGVIGVWVPSAPSGSNVGSDAVIDPSHNQLMHQFTTGLFVGVNFSFSQGR
jgi:hypothetical protein